MNPYYENRTTDLVIQHRNRLQCAAHLHRHLELVFFDGGECVGYADTERCVLKPGDVFLSFPDQVHRYESYAPEDSVILIVDPDMMPELAEFFKRGAPSSALLRGAADHPVLRHAVNELLRDPRPTTPAGLVVRHGHLLTLFGTLLAMYDLSAPPTTASNTFKAVVEYCTQNYAKELSLSALERELHVSKYYISHLFSDKLGMGFNDYINSIRVSAACRLLKHTDHPITQIASMVGFSTLRTFNRAFQKQMKQTPSEYKKMQKEQQK